MATVGVDTNARVCANWSSHCHEQREFVAALDMIPLTATWAPSRWTPRTRTIEDIERLAAEALPGWEFFSAGAFTSWSPCARRSTWDASLRRRASQLRGGQPAGLRRPALPHAEQLHEAPVPGGRARAARARPEMETKLRAVCWAAAGRARGASWPTAWRSGGWDAITSI